LSAYRLSSPYERPPLQRRASGLVLAVAINLALVLALLGMGKFAPEPPKASRSLVVDLLPESQSAQAPTTTEAVQKLVKHRQSRPAVKPPPVVLPVKPTIAVPPAPPHSVQILAMSKEDMEAGDIAHVPKAGTESADGDSKVVGHGPHGEVLYAAEWARHPTDAELGGYLPPNAPEGYGLIACKTIPGDRVDDCVELDQEPHGSHLASAVRQAAWQFRIRPPRKNGVPLVGSWVSIRIDYIGRSNRSL
jgi:protein TonB